MRFPENLKKSGTIGFVAPSFGCTTEPYKSAFANAQKKWKEMGYQLDLGPNCYAEHGIGISAAPEECGKELTEYYVSEKNDCLISCGGGELMCEDLDYVDFEKIRRHRRNGISAILTIRILRIFCRPSAIRRLFTVRVRVISAWSRGINP